MESARSKQAQRWSWASAWRPSASSALTRASAQPKWGTAHDVDGVRSSGCRVECPERLLGASGAEKALGDLGRVVRVRPFARGVEAEVLVHVALGVGDGEQRLASAPAVAVVLRQPLLEVRESRRPQDRRQGRNDGKMPAASRGQRPAQDQVLCHMGVLHPRCVGAPLRHAPA